MVGGELFANLGLFAACYMYVFGTIFMAGRFRYLMGTAYLPEPLHKVACVFFEAVVPKSKEPMRFP